MQLNWDSIKYFKKEDFQCKCHRHNNNNPALPKYAEWNYFYLCRYFLDPLRKDTGYPIIVSSAYRCYLHNRDIGGSSKSQHTIILPLENAEKDIRPCAVDIYSTVLNYKQFDNKIKANTNINYCGYHIYTRKQGGRVLYFVHIDFRGIMARW
jgi:hypothetical protein